MTTTEPSDTLRSGVVRGSRPVTGVVVAWVFALLPANFVPPIMAGLVVEYGFGVDAAGFVVTGMTIANAVTVLATRAAVRRGYRVLIARLGIAVLALACVTALALPSATTIAAALIVGGVGSGAAIAAATAGASATRNPDGTTQITIILNRVVVALAFLVLPLVGGGLASVFTLVAVLGVVAFVAAHWIPRPPTVAQTFDAEAVPDPVGVRPVAWLLAISFAVLTITEEGTYALLQLFMMTNIPALDSAAISLIFAASILAGLVGALISPLALRWFGRIPSLAVLLTLSVLAKLGLVFVTDHALYIVANLTWGFAFGAIIPLVFGLAASVARSGSAVVLLNGIYIVGVALGPLAATQLIGAGAPAFGIVFAVAAVAASIGVLIAVRRGQPLVSVAEETVEA